MINKPIDPYIRTSKHSQTLLINQLSLQRVEDGETVFKFGFGQSPFPVPQDIQKALAGATHRKEYMSVQGYPPLRAAIAGFHKELESKDWSEDRIIVGSGSKILLFCLMAAFTKAEILIPAPSWVSYAPQAALLGHKVSWIHTQFDDQWKLQPDQLRTFCTSRKDPDVPAVLIFNTPSNPTGHSYSKGELQALAVVMREHNIVVIADEIYSLLTYESGHSTLDEFYPEGCIVTSGLSKWCGAGGWRLGFAHIPKQMGPKYFQAVMGVASETYSCAPSPIQIGATQAYENLSLAKSFLAQQIEILSEISRTCANTLRQAGLQVHGAAGGFYLFPEFENFRDKLGARGIQSAEDLTNALMTETGVALLPGSAFGMPDDSLTARLAFVDFDGDKVLEASGAPDYSRVKLGINALCNWLHEL
jgi:aspartate aminotransferase